MADETHNAGPLSWRDVYKAVEDSERRILAAVDKWGSGPRSSIAWSPRDKIESWLVF